MRLGIDDTDSPQGGCTTWVLTELAAVARDDGLGLVGEPRLVRLNPNVPWKTRGNAALSMRVGRGVGRPAIVGEVGGRPILAYPRGLEPSAEARQRFLEHAWAAVLRAAPSDRGTDPALVATADRLPAALYWQAVRDVVRVGAAAEALRRAGATVRVRSGRRGLVGAAAAVAWPGRGATWELIAYRPAERWGTPRELDRESVLEAARRAPELFLCHDPATRRVLVAPHTACPILFGLRGTSAASVRAAFRSVRSEPWDRWMLFRTNQGSGDHLVARAARELVGYRSGSVAGVLSGPVGVLPGGHVRFDLRDVEGELLPCVAFEPTKTLPAVARQLLPGDRLRVWGSRGDAGAVRLEGIEVVRLAAQRRRSPPLCASCGRRTRSLGTGRGWRCDTCRVRLPPEAARWEEKRRALVPGIYHPTPSARRHLAPLAP